jgi:hypothetical protein
VRVNIPLEHSYRLDDVVAARVLIEPGAQEARMRYAGLEEPFFASAARLGRDQKAMVAAAWPRHRAAS